MDNLRLRERSERRGQVKVLMRYKETGKMQKTASFARGARPGGGSSEGTLLAAMRAHTHVRIHLIAVGCCCCCCCFWRYWTDVVAGYTIVTQQGEMITATVLWKLSWSPGEKKNISAIFLAKLAVFFLSRYIFPMASFLGWANLSLCYCIRDCAFVDLFGLSGSLNPISNSR